MTNKPTVTVTEVKPSLTEIEENAKAKLIVCKTLDELKTAYSSLNKLEANIQSVIELKDKLKQTLK